MAIIVVEGIDRVGKTTLVNRIKDYFEYDPYLKFDIFKHDESLFSYDKMDNDNETDKMVQLIEMVDICGGNIIFDRFHLSEFVYGVCERNYSFRDAYMNRILVDDMLCRVGAVLVYVAPTSVVWSSSKHGSDLNMHDKLMRASFEDSGMKKIMTSFDKFRDDTSCERLIYEIRDALTEV